MHWFIFQVTFHLTACAMCILSPHLITVEQNTSPEVKAENSPRSLVESDEGADAFVETAGCSLRKKHLQLQVCCSRPMYSM